MHKYLTLILLWGLGLFAHAQTTSPFKLIQADSIIRQRGELIFSFILPPSISVHEISKLISIDKIKGEKIRAYANRKEMDKFLKLGIDFAIEQPATLQSNLKSAQKSYSSWNQYPTYEQYDSLMKNFPVIFPGLCQLEEIGKSINGRSLYYMKLGNHALIHEDKPEILFAGCIHGDELTSYILPLRLIEYLLKNYNTPQVKALMDTAEIWICPLANPDATYFGGNTNISKSRRYNANFVDLNRNFPDPVGGDHPDNEDWQPENIAVMSFLNKHNFSLSANFHAGSELVNYPWDTWSRTHPDDVWFQLISRQYADTVHHYSPSDFFIDLNDGITDGYAWYSIEGGRQDYVTYFKHGREVTIELDSQKIVPEKDLENYWNYHYRSMINYLKQINNGFRGKITDKDTGSPLTATIAIVGHDFDNSQVVSDPLTGMYYRMIAPGNYSLIISADGYLTAVTPEINLLSKSQVIKDIQLEPIQSGIHKNRLAQSAYIYPNPVSSALNLFFSNSNYTNIHLSIVDISGKTIYSTISKNTNDNINIPVENLSPGLYFLQLNTPNENAELKFIKQ